MELDTFRRLLTSAGKTALAEAASLTPTEVTFLAGFEKLRKHHDADLTKAALETARANLHRRDAE